MVDHPINQDALARAAAQRALRAAAAADLIIRCVDGSVAAAGGALEADPRTIVVVTKSDLPAAFEAPPGAIRVSARTGEGLDALAHAVATRLLGRDPAGVRRPGS